MKALLNLATSVGVSISAMVNPGAKGSALACHDLFLSDARPVIHAAKASALEKWQKLNATGSLDAVARELEITLMLNDLDLPIFGQRLERVMDALLLKPQPVGASEFFAEVHALLLAEGLPEKLIQKGIKRQHPRDIDALYRLMGNLTFKETREMYMGVAHGLEFTTESLVGQYLAESGASFKKMSLKNVVDNTRFTEERLVIAVSAASFPTFMKYFSGRTVMSVFGHAAVFTGGRTYTHSGTKGELRAMTPTTPLPLLIMKPSEGERLHRYVELSVSPKYSGHWSHPLKKPWSLDGYAPEGAFSCCTHWIGNAPIGDKPVLRYAMPNGLAWDYLAQRQVEKTAEVRDLKPWKTEGFEDLRQVWKFPGNEQLSSVIGQLDKNVAGEFASPGYVIQTLFGPTTNERVPIVVYFVNDHQAGIADNPPLRFEAPQ